ncbi:Methyl-accepting chemotaxis protein PctB [Poriferisphaera corsica]|uniref:Methyl-accepting chemotaxis protein PctB n=1 Tax=Poriferisphaera corsica TaxID=2528020 RepID=A0A517YX34_9BACT|nr:methyl-accepting chemotaxis protein [Poriferisphaera corsica]QDU34766.1 Methyl-accepting chemotaxis protein PctB [Poriferisphaera corsica]
MNFKSVRAKITFWSGLALTLTILTSTIFSGWKAWSDAKSYAEQEALKNTFDASRIIKSTLDKNISMSRILAGYAAHSLDENLSKVKDPQQVQAILEQALVDNPEHVGAWIYFRPGITTNSEQYKLEASKHSLWYSGRISGNQFEWQFGADDESNVEDWAQVSYRTRKAHMTDPYYYKIGGKDVLIATFSVPIIIDNQTVGVAGLDFPLKGMQQLADSYNLYDGQANMVILSPNAFVMGYTNKPDNLNKDEAKLDSQFAKNRDTIISGTPMNWWNDGKLKVFQPNQIDAGSQYATVLMTVPEDLILAPAKIALIEMIGLGFICLITAGLLIWYIAGKISRPIIEVVDGMNDISQGEGDLTKRLDRKTDDEVGDLADAFNNFAEKVHDIILNVSLTTQEVAGAATEIAASSEEIAQGMSEQNAQVTEVSSAIEEMSASIVEVASRSHEAKDYADNAKDLAESGGNIVSQTVNGIKQISSDSTQVGSLIGELGKQAEKIGEIISVINDISDQTNLLALNAAIEAARAGEHGRGFAVVADEVRKLADRTTKATDDITELIDAIQTQTNSAIEKMDASKSNVEQGVDTATQAGNSLGEIMDGADKIAGMIQTIAAASEQQSAASEQISSNIQAISAVTAQSQQGTTQAAQASNHLSERAEELKQLVGQFKTREAA